MGQMSPTSVHTLEGKKLPWEVHDRPPDFPDPQTQGSAAWEPESANPKVYVRVHQARKPVLDEGARVRPGPWSSPDAMTTNPATCLGSALQLEGGKTFTYHVWGASCMLPHLPLIFLIFIYPFRYMTYLWFMTRSGLLPWRECGCEEPRTLGRQRA